MLPPACSGRIVPQAVGYVHGYRRFRGLAPTFSRGSAGPSTNFSAWPVRKEAALTLGVADMYAAIAGGSKGYWQLAKMLPNVLRG